MISFLRGRILSQEPPELVLDVAGVGYEVFAPMSTYVHLPHQSEEVGLHIHTLVREDAILLYGFLTQEERLLFRTLLKVNGVGAKLGLAILSGMSVAEFAEAVASDNPTPLTKLPGVGKKTAERLLIEMRDRIAAWPSATTARLPMSASGMAAQTVQSQLLVDVSDKEAMAMQALESLGYKPLDAKKMIQGVYQDDLEVAQLIRLALQKVARV